jgi:hypothetical protein
MLRKSISIFKVSAAVIFLGILVYFFKEMYGKYIIGSGMMFLALGLIFYILFMFKRYGDQKKIF